MAKIIVEGNSIDLPDEECKTNKALIDALLPFYSAVANAEIKRETIDGETVITVTKQAGPKGSYAPVVAALDAAPETISPVLLLAAVSPEPKKLATAELDKAILKMLDDETEISRVLKALGEAAPQSATIPPRGF